MLKAVALGASAVLVARQWVWGLALEGQAGVEQVVKGLLADTDLRMALCGKARKVPSTAPSSGGDTAS